MRRTPKPKDDAFVPLSRSLQNSAAVLDIAANRRGFINSCLCFAGFVVLHLLNFYNGA